MKRIFSFLIPILTLALLFGVAACSSKSDEPAGKPDYSELKPILAEMKELIGLQNSPTSGYPSSAYSILRKAITEVETLILGVDKGTVTSQSEVNKVIETAKKALEEFKATYSPAATIDYSKLADVIEEMSRLLENEGKTGSGYSAEAFSALKTAKSAAESVLSDAKDLKLSNQSDVDSAIDAANAAIDAFKASWVYTPAACELYIPGATDPTSYIALGDPGEYDDLVTLTVDFWFKGDEKLHYQKQGIIIGNFTGKQPWCGWALNSWSNADSGFGAPYTLRSSRGWSGNGLSEPSAAWNNYTEWQHIGYTFTASPAVTVCYINGEKLFDQDLKASEYQKPESPVQMYMFRNPGTAPGAANPMGISAKVKKLRIWSKALTQEQIKALANTEVTGTEDGLVAAWDLDIVPENPKKIVDKTGKHTLGVFGDKVEWQLK